MKKKRGVCVFEFNESGSCRYRNKCWHSHEFPPIVREDPDIKLHVASIMQKLSSKQTHSQKLSSKQTQSSQLSSSKPKSPPSLMSIITKFEQQGYPSMSNANIKPCDNLSNTPTPTVSNAPSTTNSVTETEILPSSSPLLDPATLHFLGQLVHTMVNAALQSHQQPHTNTTTQ